MSNRIQVPARWDSLEPLMSYLDQVEQTLPLSEAQRYLARLAVEEVATNIIKYGYDGPPGSMIVQCDSIQGELQVTIRDDGRPFDLSTASIDLPPEDVRTRQPGGLGIILVRHLADKVSYRHDSVTGWNELIVYKK